MTKLRNTSQMIDTGELCGCGRPVRYMSTNGGEGACNKYGRCPSYDELRTENRKLNGQIVYIQSRAIELKLALDRLIEERDGK